VKRQGQREAVLVCAAVIEQPLHTTVCVGSTLRSVLLPLLLQLLLLLLLLLKQLNLPLLLE
jgi:hypothetical protein